MSAREVVSLGGGLKETIKGPTQEAARTLLEAFDRYGSEWLRASRRTHTDRRLNPLIYWETDDELIGMGMRTTGVPVSEPVG